MADYGTTGLSLKAHPLSFVRDVLTARGVRPAAALLDPDGAPHGTRAAVAGLVLVRQRPATASGILFVTLEDETGIANLIVRPAVYDRYRAAARHAGALVATGTVERDGVVVHLLVRALVPLRTLVTTSSRDFR